MPLHGSIMDFFTLLLGVMVGFGLGTWERYRLKSRLRPLLTSLPDTAEVAQSLSLTSLVRREITYLSEKCQAYQEELELWQYLMDQSPLGYLRIDADNYLRWCNPQAQQLLKIDRWQPDQLRLVLELVRSYELDQLIEKTRQSQQNRVEEWFFYPAPESVENGQQSFALSSRLLRGYSYALPQKQVVVMLENLQPLAELTRSRDRAFSDLTHELRTPLTAISLVAETLEKRLQNPERQWVEQMLGETKRLQYLVENWLNLTAIQENPQQFLQYQPLELRELIFDRWQSLQPFVQRKPVRWQYQGPEEVRLEADPDRLMQVFLNLFDNSLKHSPPDGLIEVKVQYLETKAVWEIQIIDQGEGFSAADLPYIFERLYRGEVSRTRQGLVRERQGSGLGLAIAKEIVEAHGGTLTAHNSPVTGGACLTIHLPQKKT